MTYTTPLKVRTYECDGYNHVNNAVYLNYLETARMDYLMQIGFKYKEMVEQGYFLYVTHIDIYYKSSAYFGDDLTIETTPVKLGAISGVFHQVIKNQEGVICVEADVHWASVKDNRPAKIPAEFMVDGLRP